MIIFIAGPTAAGKTAVSEGIARKTSAEIISADSRQIYKYLSIGTSKPKGKWVRMTGMYCAGNVPYHLVDFMEPDKTFSAGDFVSCAQIIIERAKKNGKNIIIAGGTGLYVKSLIYGITELPPKSEGIRKDLYGIFKKMGSGFIHNKLKKVDPAAAAAIHPGNIQRIIRALEVYEITKKPISEWHSDGKKRGGLLHEKNGLLIFGLNMPRQELYSRINKRCEKMLKEGMVEETEDLLKKFPENITALSSVGYPHVVKFIKGNIDRKTLFEKVSRDTRNYAKRQITWFNADKNIKWFNSGDNLNNILHKILESWKE